VAYNRGPAQPVSKQLTIVIGLTVVGFMAFGLALSFYRNILFEQTLQNIENENARIAQTIDRGYGDLEYYRSGQYKDKYAKENLGRLNPGEKLIIITPDPDARAPSTQSGSTERDRQEAAYFELLQQMPVVEHWQLFLFNRDKLEELKKGI
jgi:hypothetical protein